jgi:hypothetical protein
MKETEKSQYIVKERKKLERKIKNRKNRKKENEEKEREREMSGWTK